MDFHQQDNSSNAEERYFLKSDISKLSQSANIGIWEFNLDDTTDLTDWAALHIAELLGYNPYAPISFNFFLTQLVHQDDRVQVYRFFDDEVKHLAHPMLEVRLLTQQSGYRWFGLSGSALWNEQGKLMRLSGILFNIDMRKRADLNLRSHERFLNTTTELLQAGGWESNLLTGAMTWTREMYRLLKAPLYFKPDTESVKKFYHPDFSADIQASLKAAIETRSAFEMDTCMLDTQNQAVWVHIKGYAVCDSQGRCTTVKGSMQLIDNQAIVDLLNGNRQLNEQNKRLQNFAHIVSHNLRSYSNNLQTMVDMMHRPEMAPEEIKECMNYIKAISTGLTNTVNHLTEIVKQQDEASRKRVQLSFKEALDAITNALQNDLNTVKAQIITDFKVATVNYLPAYLDSILLNLVTNAVKYRHPDRDLLLRIATYERDTHIYLTIEDNGLGIDLHRYGSSLFGMYKTFHQHPDSRGLGLFMTRNQVETLGGSIDVESEPNVGTKFTIRLV